jgi:RNA polymerase-binding protein DksA
MDASMIEERKRILEAERERVLEMIAEYEREDQETLSDLSGENNYRDHMADQGSATFARELDMTLEEQTRQSLEQIDRALEAIAEGRYGLCARCGEAIPAERLEAMPEAELCVACKEREESA